MPTTIAKVFVPPPVAAPRGARWAAEAAAGLLGAGRAIWRGLERVGQRRAAHKLLARADLVAPHDPELAADLRAAARFDTVDNR